MSFFDYSMMNNANRIIAENAVKVIPKEKLIQNEIRNWIDSPKRKWQIVGNNYYEGKHDILKKKRMAIGRGGELEEQTNLPNSRNIDNQYRKMVKQKVNYIAGKPFSIVSENEEYQENLKKVFNKNFMRQFKNVVKDSLNCAIGWLYVYYDEKGKLSFKRFKPWEVLPGWTDAEHTKLEYIIRPYIVDVYDGNTTKKVVKVEYYSLKGIDYYEYYGGDLKPCEPWHKDYFNVGEIAYNWERLPFVPFKYNDEETPLIKNCKSLQDGINTILSNFQDNMLEDPRNTILVLINYDGENLGEFRHNLSQYGAVKVRSNDGVSGGVQTLQVAVNSENYKAILQILRNAIVENCMGYDAKDERMSGTPNQMNIQSMYNDIDMDASDMETEYQAAFEDLVWFINNYFATFGIGNFENEDFEIIFNTDMPMDEASTIDNIQKSVGILSTETLIANHPWTSGSPKEELEKLEKEKREAMEQYQDAFNLQNTTPPTETES